MNNRIVFPITDLNINHDPPVFAADKIEPRGSQPNFNGCSNTSKEIYEIHVKESDGNISEYKEPLILINLIVSKAKYTNEKHMSR